MPEHPLLAAVGDAATGLYQVAPISTNLVLGDIATHTQPLARAMQAHLIKC